MNVRAYTILKKCIIDQVVEEQAKLGYHREVIRLYYPLASLNHFFEDRLSHKMNAQEMQLALIEFSGCMERDYGKVDVSHQKDRFCFTLHEEISEKVHKQKSQYKFIYQLVELVQKHGVKMERVIALFEKQPYPCEVEYPEHGEFDVLIHFTKGEDKYYYCLKEEGRHITYHRYLPEDYKDFRF